MDMNQLLLFLHATLQIITVGIGSPLGREVAPRGLALVLLPFS